MTDLFIGIAIGMAVTVLITTVIGIATGPELVDLKIKGKVIDNAQSGYSEKCVVALQTGDNVVTSDKCTLKPGTEVMMQRESKYPNWHVVEED